MYRLIEEKKYEQVFCLETLVSIIDIAHQALKKRFTSHVIEASFEGVGLYPFSLSRMKQLALKNHVKCGK
jgi:hypothetical protein